MTVVSISYGHIFIQTVTSIHVQLNLKSYSNTDKILILAKYWFNPERPVSK